MYFYINECLKTRKKKDRYEEFELGLHQKTDSCDEEAFAQAGIQEDFLFCGFRKVDLASLQGFSLLRIET